MGTPPSNAPFDDAPLSEARMAMLRTRREARRELQLRAAMVFAATPASSFSGFRALVRAVMPTSPPERDDLSTRLGVHPAAIEWLLDETLEWYDVEGNVIVDLAWTLGLTRQTFLELLVRDLNREAEEGGGRVRNAAGWIEVTSPLLSLWDETAGTTSTAADPERDAE